MNHTALWRALSLAALFTQTVLAAPSARAQDGVANFYRGKTIRIINPFAETGFYGAMMHALSTAADEGLQQQSDRTVVISSTSQWA